MIVVDTNVLSELIRSRPSRRVEDWFGTHATASLFTTTITLAEMLLGVALLASGRRRTVLEAAVSAMFDDDFRDRVLGFDDPAAREFAQISARRRRAGRPITHADAQIAAIVRSRGAILATRNVEDFRDCEIEIINPWD